MSGLVFVGDTVWPARDCIDFESILPALRGKQLVVNLEGPILERPPGECRVTNPYKTSLHSDPQVLEVLKRLGVVACDLANNHINDYAGSVDPTIRQLSGAGIDHFGTETRTHVEVISGGVRFLLVGACSELPERKAYPGDSNPHLLRPRELLADVASLRAAQPDARIVCVVHWGYELTLYPEPADREWAHRAIDAGANYVIGHHPHVVQGVETVGGGFIAYSLGNFLMPHGLYNGVRLGFNAPEVLIQLGIELSEGDPRLHWFRYDRERSCVSPMTGEEGLEGLTLLGARSPFIGMTHAQYRAWFATVGVKGHLTIRRGGPTYRGYFGLHGYVASANDLYMRLKRQLRKGLMRVGLHKPARS